MLVAGLIGIGVLALLLAMLHAGQRSLMYFPERARTSPSDAGLPQAQEVILETGDGERLVAWHVPPRADKPVVLYFHGNGGALRARATRFARLIADGTGLLALSYRGYGGSTGRPSETGLGNDAKAAYDFAARRYPTAGLVLWGESLGTGVAVALAAERPVSGLILEAPFTSAVDIAAAAYPFLPVRSMMKDQFRSDARIGKVRAPVLMLHGGQDRVVPVSLGRQLFDLVRAPKKFLEFPEGGHSDLDDYGAWTAIRQFLLDLGKSDAPLLN